MVKHWIGAVESRGTSDTVDDLPGGNRELNCSQQVEVAGRAGHRVNVERELVHARSVSHGTAARSTIGQAIKHVRKSIVIEIGSKSTEAVDVGAAVSSVQRSLVQCRAGNHQHVLERRGVCGRCEQERDEQ